VSYETVMVQLDAFDFSNSLVDLAVDLCRRFDARLIGFSACNVRPILTAPDGLTIAGELFEQERNTIRERLNGAEVDFRRMTETVSNVEWRGYIGIPTQILAEQALAADLIVTRGPHPGASDYDRTVNIGELVLEAGRPVLVAGEGATTVGSRALVAWKNVREARRAVVDALPFLREAEEVRVVTVTDGDGLAAKVELDGVVAFLSRHGVTNASGEVISADDGTGEPLLSKAREMRADLVVSGASKILLVGPASMISPRYMNTVVCETRAACCMLWVTITIV
jgi:nucleotide-binding universal stress UspA family protein